VQGTRPGGRLTPHLNRFAALLGLVLVAAFAHTIPASAAVTKFDDKRKFVDQTGATSATGPLPNLGAATPRPVTVGSITFNAVDRLFLGAAGTSVEDFSPLIPGHDIGLSGSENLDIKTVSPVRALGFDFAEPNAASAGLGCNTTCTDSTFTVTLKEGATTVGSFTFNAPDDVLAFVGVTSDTPFDTALIRENTATIDNEYFGEVYTSTVANVDPDGDGVRDPSDNCPSDSNVDQHDGDGDGRGDACDDDRDGDTVANDADNCAGVPNVDQRDIDADTIGDACDQDRDGDTVADDADNCVEAPNVDQRDIDADSVGDACDQDRDGDTVGNDTDNCADTPNADQADTDGDGMGDSCDEDRDGDTVPDASDNCAGQPNVDQANADGDGVGDACDTDRDGDGVSNTSDNCVDTANSGQQDADGDNVGDACDPESR